MNPLEQSNPAMLLAGKKLNNNWEVVDLITKHPDGTGGNFSVSYSVVNIDTGEKAFLKALDFSRALKDENPLEAMGKLTGYFQFEQNVLELCKSKRLNRIINLIEAGTVTAENGSIIPVPYFIMELAAGDIYHQLDFTKIDHLLNLKILHNVSVALFQLHNNGISHQDVKPSNVLVIKDGPHKLGDLGRADLRGVNTPYGFMAFAGDPAYAAPEVHYKAVSEDWVFRRIASDAYQLGSIITFLFTQLNMTAIMKIHIAPEHNWSNWTQTYREVLPYLYVALEQSIDFFKGYVDDKELAEELGELLFQLCDPDPSKRGHPKTLMSKNKTISLERYNTIFDRLLKKYEMRALRYYSN
jgi:eukaryotic-like serine/threonine-protein kinase